MTAPALEPEKVNCFPFNSIEPLGSSVTAFSLLLQGSLVELSPGWYFHNESTRLRGDTPLLSVAVWDGPFSTALRPLRGPLSRRGSAR